MIFKVYVKWEWSEKKTCRKDFASSSAFINAQLNNLKILLIAVGEALIKLSGS